MEQYISKAAVMAEIEKRLKVLNNDRDFNWLQIKELEALLPFLDTLEAKEEILDKEGKAKLMKKCVHKAYKRGYDMGVLLTTNEMNHNMKEMDLEKEINLWIEDNTCRGYCSANIRETAEHFFELGLKAQMEKG